MIYICFSLCTDGAGYITQTGEGTGPTRYFDSSGEVIGIYYQSDYPQFCESSGDYYFEIYAGNTDGCEIECQIGRDCSGNYPECD